MKPVSVLEAVTKSIALYIRSYPTLLIPILIVAAFQLLEPVIAGLAVNLNLESNQVLAALAIMFIPILFFLLIVGSYISCMVYIILYKHSQHKGCAIDEMIGFANKSFGAILWYRITIFGIFLLIGGIIAILFYALEAIIVPFVFFLGIVMMYLGCRLFLSEWLVVHKKLGPIEALKTSYGLTEKRAGKVFLSFVILFIFLVILSALVGMIVSVITGVSYETLMDKETVGGAKSIYDFMMYLLVGVYYEAFAVNYYVRAGMDQTETSTDEGEHQVDDTTGIQG